VPYSNENKTTARKAIRLSLTNFHNPKPHIIRRPKNRRVARPLSAARSLSVFPVSAVKEQNKKKVEGSPSRALK
jgi:hypothetical protein